MKTMGKNAVTMVTVTQSHTNARAMKRGLA